MTNPDQDRIEALIRDAEWLRGHDPELGRALLSRATTIARAQGEWVYAEGDAATGLFIVLEGLVQVYCGATGGISCLIGQTGPGAILGQAVRFGGGPRLHTLVCATDSVLLRVSDVAIGEIAARRPDMWHLVVSVLYRQLRGALTMLTQSIALPPRRRLAARLCMFADGSGGVSLSQAALAETLGLTRKTVNQHLAEFEREALIGRAYGRVTLLRPDLLARIAEAELAPPV